MYKVARGSAITQEKERLVAGSTSLLCCHMLRPLLCTVAQFLAYNALLLGP